MIKLITLNNPRMAQAFIDYMATRDIKIQLFSEGADQFSLWLMDDTVQDDVVSELQHFCITLMILNIRKRRGRSLTIKLPNFLIGLLV